MTGRTQGHARFLQGPISLEEEVDQMLDLHPSHHYGQVGTSTVHRDPPACLAFVAGRLSLL